MHKVQGERSELGHIREGLRKLEQPAKSACESELLIPSEDGIASNLASENQKADE